MIFRPVPHPLFLRAAFLAALIFGLFSHEGNAQNVGGLGLQMRLTTSGASFTVTDPPAGSTASRSRTRLAQRESIVAAATLTNLSNADVALFYDHAGAAANRFQFQVLNSAGTAVWVSELYLDTVGAPASDQAVLKSRATLQRTVQIPLRLGDSWLPSGRYTLVASTGARGPQATAIFDVISPIPANDTGITGTVRVYNAGADPTPTRADLSIVEVRPPGSRSTRPLFTWTGASDAQGLFRVVTPPGKFTVTLFLQTTTAARPALPGSSNTIINLGPVTVTPPVNTPRTVLVVPGQFTTCDLTLQGLPQPTLNLVPVVASAKLSDFGATDSIPPTFFCQLRAVGTTTTGGYRNPRLVRRPTDPAHPEILGFDFLIDSPDPNGAITQGFENHNASISIVGSLAPTVRVYGASNFVDALSVIVSP